MPPDPLLLGPPPLPCPRSLCLVSFDSQAEAGVLLAVGTAQGLKFYPKEVQSEWNLLDDVACVLDQHKCVWRLLPPRSTSLCAAPTIAAAPSPARLLQTATCACTASWTRASG